MEKIFEQEMFVSDVNAITTLQPEIAKKAQAGVNAAKNSKNPTVTIAVKDITTIQTVSLVTAT